MKVQSSWRKNHGKKSVHHELSIYFYFIDGFWQKGEFFPDLLLLLGPTGQRLTCGSDERLEHEHEQGNGSAFLHLLAIVLHIILVIVVLHMMIREWQRCRDYPRSPDLGERGRALSRSHSHLLLCAIEEFSMYTP